MVPWPLVTLAAVAALLFVLLRRRAGRRARNRLDHAVHSRAAAGLVACYSPQYILWLFPLLLLAFPRRGGILFALGFTALLFAEYGPQAADPDLFLRLYPWIVSARTLLTLAVAVLAAARQWITFLHPRSAAHG